MSNSSYGIQHMLELVSADQQEIASALYGQEIQLRTPTKKDGW